MANYSSQKSTPLSFSTRETPQIIQHHLLKLHNHVACLARKSSKITIEKLKSQIEFLTQSLNSDKMESLTKIKILEQKNHILYANNQKLTEALAIVSSNNDQYLKIITDLNVKKRPINK